MAGIIANSASVTLLAAGTAADNTKAGYIVAEQVTLSATPTGTAYVWSISIPSGSSAARTALSSTTAASPKFTPDVGGEYTVTLVVDSTTTYVLRLSVTQSTASTSVEALRMQKKTATSVPAPSANVLTTFLSSTDGDIPVHKDSSGLVYPAFGLGTLGAALTDADASVDVGDGVRRVLPAATLTANRQLTLGTTGASAGHVIEVSRLDATAFTYAIINGGAGAGTLLTMPVSVRTWGSFVFDGTNWALDRRKELT